MYRSIMQRKKGVASKLIVKLDVGGTIFRTYKETLQSSKYLTSLVNGDWSESQEECIFIDRDAFLFRYVLLFLRTGELDLEDKHHLLGLRGEANFFLLDKLEEIIIEKLEDLNKPPKKLNYQLISQDKIKSFSKLTLNSSMTNSTVSTSLADKGYTVITSLNYEKRVYKCPRNIYRHLDYFKCGYKCADVKPLDTCWTYEPVNLLLVVYDK